MPGRAWERARRAILPKQASPATSHRSQLSLAQSPGRGGPKFFRIAKGGFVKA